MQHVSNKPENKKLTLGVGLRLQKIVSRLAAALDGQQLADQDACASDPLSGLVYRKSF